MTKSKSDIMKLENDKAEKLHVDGEFKRVDRELNSLKEWCAKLEEMIKKLTALINDNSQFAMLSKKVTNLEDLIAKLQNRLEELRSMRTQATTINTAVIDTRDSLGDDNFMKDLTARVNYLQAELENLKNEFARWVKEL
jgi:prefoldin subunit 5